MEENKTQQNLFREKTLERISSPEKLTDYLRVTNPGIWAVLGAVIILLGGLFIWAEMPAGIDAVLMLQKAVERKVAYVPGTYFCSDGGHTNTLRLNFSNSTEEQIETGMSILREIVTNEIK